MPGLYDDIRRGTERDNSLFADIMRTVGSTAMTFGSQALKGLTMGAIDTGDLVSDLLGKDVYEAPPAWAMKGAELAGELPLIHGAVVGASAVLPSMGTGVAADIMRRAGIGMLAGTGLGAVRGGVSGDPNWMKNSLLEGLMFGGIEAAFGVPQLARNLGWTRMAKRNRMLLETSTKTAAEAEAGAHTPDALNLAEDQSAYARAAMGERSRGMPPEPPRGTAELVSQAELRDALTMQHTDLMTQSPAHDLWHRPGRPPQSFILQSIKGDMDVYLISAGKMEGKKGLHLTFEDIATGQDHTVPLSNFLRKERVTHRLFRGKLGQLHLPPNTYNELYRAKKNLGDLIGGLHKRGQLGKDQIKEFYRYVQPNATGMGDLADWQVRRIEQLIRQGAEGKGLPEALFDVVGPIGKEVGEAQLGALAYFQPARWVAESMSRKMGGAKWVQSGAPTRCFYTTVSGVSPKG